MPRWLQILLTLVLFAAMMLAVRTILVAVLPAHNAWMDQMLGKEVHFALTLAVILGAGIFAFWPRAPLGRMKPLLSRRR